MPACQLEYDKTVSGTPNPKQGQRWLGPVAPSRSALIPPISAARWLLVLIVIAGIYFFHGFLVPVLAALVVGFASWPLYRKLLRHTGGNTTIGATLAIIFILIFLIVPEIGRAHSELQSLMRNSYAVFCLK